MVRHCLACLVILGVETTAHAKGKPAVLEIELVDRSTSVRVFLGATQLIPDANLRVELPGSGLQMLRIDYGGSDSHRALIALGPGVKVHATQAWGVRIVAQPEGSRCGEVSGHRGDWFACDGESPLPQRTRFALVCAAPAAMASEHYYSLDRGSDESVASDSFLPTLPGLYRAHYKNGRITISYRRHACS